MIDLRPDYLEIVRDLLRQHVPECEVRAFGSRFKWTAKQASDLDLAVVGTKRLPTKKIMRLKEAFEESILPMRVDVLDWHAITPEFQRVIDAGFEVIQGGEVSPLASASSPSAAGSSATPLYQTGLNRTSFQSLIDDQILEIGDGYRAQNSELGGIGEIFLRSGHVTDTHIEFNGIERFHEHLFEKVQSKLSKVDDTIVTTKGNSTGRTSFVTLDMPSFVYSPHLSYWRTLKPEVLCGGFLRYWSRGSEFIEQLSGMKTSTDMAPYLSLTDQRRLKISLPNIKIQKAIANILGALDDRIEVYRRTNETLESTARVLFKDWFIDFGPVRAKMEGRDPYLSADVWSLFPDRLVDSELGEIPKGWEYVPVSEIIEFNPTESLKKGVVAPYIDMAALPTVGSNTERPVPREFGSGMKFRNNDTLMARITPCLENGKTAYVQCLPEDAIGWGSTEFIVMRPKAPVPSEYAYILARDSNFRKHAIQSMTGTSGRQRAQATMIANYTVANATPKIWEAFSDAIKSCFISIGMNSDMTESLSSLRDNLLPKLLSGELSVPEAMLQAQVLG